MLMKVEYDDNWFRFDSRIKRETGESPVRSRRCKGEMLEKMPLGNWEGFSIVEPKSEDLPISLHKFLYER